MRKRIVLNMTTMNLLWYFLLMSCMVEKFWANTMVLLCFHIGDILCLFTACVCVFVCKRKTGMFCALVFLRWLTWMRPTSILFISYPQIGTNVCEDTLHYRFLHYRVFINLLFEIVLEIVGEITFYVLAFIDNKKCNVMHYMWY